MIDISLLEDFITGAGENLDEMETALLQLEITPDNNELLHTTFRAMHTIKGAAQFVGLENVSSLSHALEDLLDVLREGRQSVTPEIIDVLIQAKDRISLLVSDLEKTKLEHTDVYDLIEKINSCLEKGEVKTDVPEVEEFLALPEGEGEDLSSFLSSCEGEGEEFPALPEGEGEDLSAFLSEDVPKNPTISSDSFNTDLLNEDTSALIEDFLREEVHSSSTEKVLEDKHLSSIFPITEEEEEIVIPDEEYDKELFSIYLQQLREKTSLLEEIIANIETTNESPDSLLQQAIDILQSLKFAANYMGYETLTRFYVKWLDELRVARENILGTHHRDTVPLAFLQTYLAKLYRVFPDLLKDQEKSQETLAVISQPVAATSPIIPYEESKTPYENKEKTESALTNLVTEIISEDTLPYMEGWVPKSQSTITSVLPVPLQTIPEPLFTRQADTTNFSDESHLFDKLSQALDSSIEKSITSEPINELFGALLSTAHPEKPKLSSDVSSQPIVKTLSQANSEPEPPSRHILSAQSQAESSAVPITERQLLKKPLVEATSSPTPTLSSKEVAAEKPIKTEAKPAVAGTDKGIKKSIRVDADKIDSLMNQVGELIVDRAYFFQLASEINELQQYLKEIGIAQKDLKPVRTFAYRFSEAIISLGRTSNELQEGVMKVRMLPISQLFNRYPRLVHDLAHNNGKKVQLEIRGEETELDKMIIEEISDPLIHMIRNAISHGIEPPAIRKQQGKPETGTLVLEAYHESNHIVIEVTDDGRGIDTDKIRAKAEEMNLFAKEELARMSTDDLTRFIMLPGFSTAKEINSTSGRGVGMDVVKKNIEKLNGTIEVESKVGIETKIRLKIPLTLAIIQALLVRVGESTFTIPLANVEETLRVEQKEISIVEETEVMYLRGKTLPIFRLTTLFGLTSDKKSGRSNFFVVVVNTGAQKIGLMVDVLLGQEEVVIKPLVDYLHEQNCFSGATIIGDGRISLILDVYELVNMATEKQVKRHEELEKRSLATIEDE